VESERAIRDLGSVPPGLKHDGRPAERGGVFLPIDKRGGRVYPPQTAENRSNCRRFRRFHHGLPVSCLSLRLGLASALGLERRPIRLIQQRRFGGDWFGSTFNREGFHGLRCVLRRGQ
jgi:hypothetical protein